MEYRKLGKTNIQVTPIAFGAWAIGGWMWGGADIDEGIRALKVSFDLGITTIDTAPVYGFGRSEELVGKAMSDIPRDKYQILTKYGMNWETHEGEYFFNTEDFNGNPIKMYKYSGKNRVKKECEDSLKRLKTDYIDLYQVHWHDSTTPIPETMEAVLELIDEGKVRAAGVCNYNVDNVNIAREVLDIVSNQVPYSLVRREIEQDVVPQAIAEGMSILPYSPLQRGLLTGKIKNDHQFKKGDSRPDMKYFTPENIARTNEMLNQIKPIADDHGATLAQIVLNWTMHQPAMTCVLAGARNERQVRDNVKALDIKLSVEELAAITAASDELEPV